MGGHVRGTTVDSCANNDPNDGATSVERIQLAATMEIWRRQRIKTCSGRITKRASRILPNDHCKTSSCEYPSPRYPLPPLSFATFVGTVQLLKNDPLGTFVAIDFIEQRQDILAEMDEMGFVPGL